MAQTSRRSASGTQMIVALLVLLVPILGISFAFTRNPDPQVPSVAYAPVAARAATASEYVVYAPATLPAGWTCTSAQWLPAGASGQAKAVVGDTWSMAFLTPERRYVGLDQRAAAPDAFVTERTREGSQDGASTAAGLDWTRYVSDDGRTRSLVHVDDSVVVVSGDLPYADLEAFAATLAPAG